MTNINFIPTPKFKKSFKRLYKKYRSLKDDFEEFRKEFSKNQEIGEDLGGGFRKVRFAIEAKNKGKSGGARVIVYNFYLQTLPNEFYLLIFTTKVSYRQCKNTNIGKLRKSLFRNKMALML